MNGDDSQDPNSSPTGTLAASLGPDSQPVDLSGSSRSFRNNNPGNLMATPMAYGNGAIGKDKDGFAVFPDYATGRAAQAQLWGTQKYGNTPIGHAVNTWGGTYANHLGIDPRLTFGQLTPQQQQQLMDLQQLHEGYKPGMASATPQLAPMPPASPYRTPTSLVAAMSQGAAPAAGTPPPPQPGAPPALFPNAPPGVPPSYSLQPPQPQYPPPSGTGATRSRMRADYNPNDPSTWS